MRVCYIDFDGVLHHHEVVVRKGQPVCVSGDLFCHVPLIEPVFEAFPDVRIVLSTTWVRAKGFTQARDKLPRHWRDRIIGATYHSTMSEMQGRGMYSSVYTLDPWQALSRYQQIANDAARRTVTRWVAVDDDDRNWPEEERFRLVKCDPEKGLGEPGKIDELTSKLLTV